ncbi:MAG TPA: HD domain-containing phosphohydrolase [Bacillales bacterium]|nr:HD domain-containing phosphohydrolase [Bacillales bacterium]
MIYKETKNLLQGDTLAEDVLRNSVLILRAGTKMNSHLKEKLMGLRVLEVAVETDDADSKNQDQSQFTMSPDKDTLSKLFHRQLKRIAVNERYGLGLQNEERVKVFENLFVSSMSIKVIYEKMMELRQWDAYSFDHSFDVFLLGMILGDAAGLDDLSSFAIGCLLHDIGKMVIPQWILYKRGKLTTAEFKEIQHHTIYGSEMIARAGLPGDFAALARSHHERLDGSGYPDGLTKEQLNKPTRILMIVDVYSAITMERVYRKPLPAAKAMEVLFRDLDKFDEDLLKMFANRLHIFPVGSDVLLSNGKKATVTYVQPSYPALPRLLMCDQPKAIQIPFNHRLRINLFVGWNEKNGQLTKREVEWNRYLYALTTGEEEDALEAFEFLEDGKRVEDIYADIFDQSIKEIDSLYQQGIITSIELNLARTSTRELLYSTLKGYERKQTKRGQIVIAPIGGETSYLPMQIAGAALKTNGWKVFNLENPLQLDELLQFLKRRSIRMISLMVTNPLHLDPLLEAMKILRRDLPNVIIAVGGNSIPHEVRKRADLHFTNIKEMVMKMEKFRDLSEG